MVNYVNGWVPESIFMYVLVLVVEVLVDVAVVLLPLPLQHLHPRPTSLLRFLCGAAVNKQAIPKKVFLLHYWQHFNGRWGKNGEEVLGGKMKNKDLGGKNSKGEGKIGRKLHKNGGKGLKIEAFWVINWKWEMIETHNIYPKTPKPQFQKCEPWLYDLRQLYSPLIGAKTFISDWLQN